MKPKLSQNLNTSNYDSVTSEINIVFLGSINLLFYYVLMFVLVMFLFVNLVNNNIVYYMGTVCYKYS